MTSRARKIIVLAFLLSFGWVYTHAQAPANQIKAENGKISANLKDIQVTEVLKILAEKSSYDFIISGGISAKITLYVQNIEPLKLLDVIAELANIAYDKKGNTIVIYSADRYRQIYNQDFIDKRVTETIHLKYVNVNTVAQSIQTLK